MSFDARRDDPDNLIDAGLRGLAKLRDLVTQIADPTASPRPRPLASSRRPPREAPRAVATDSAGAREPASDIFDEGDWIRVVADMPGADPDTVRVTGDGHRLSIAAHGGSRRYAKTLLLPKPVLPAPAPPTLINGIMEALLPVDEVAVAPPAPAAAIDDETGS